MFTTLLVDEHGRRDTGHSNRRISVDEEKKVSTCSKIFSCIKLFFAHLFGHIGLTALVVGYSIFGAFLFSYLEGANEILIRVKVGNKRGETLEELWNVTADLRDLVIEQELEIVRLREALDAETLARSRCQDNRRREGSFLEAIIDECKRDNVPLTDWSCSEFCRKNQVTLPVCKALCQTEVPPCSYWHKDTHKAPIVSFEEVTNRTRREESKAEIWLERLQEYREMGSKRITRELETGVTEDINSKIDSREDLVNFAGYEGGIVSEDENYGSQFIQVIQLSNETECHQLSCVTHDDSNVVACLDFTHLNKSAGFFRLQNWREINSTDPNSITERFNVLWKANWTRDAEKILKAFEKDVILKVKTDGYDGKEAVEGDVVQEPSQWSLSGALLYSVTIITTIGYGNIAPKTSIGQIVTMVYATFGMPVFMLWASNMGTLMAQTFTFLYAHFCCFVCRRADRRKAERLMKKRAEREREREKTGSTRLLWSERDGSPGMTMSSRLDSTSPWNGGTLGRNGRQGITDPDVKNLLTTCAKYNIYEGHDDDPLSEAVVEEIRHADTMDIIHERLMSAPQSPKKHAHKNEKMFPREMREGSAYENPGENVDTGQDRSKDTKTKEAYILSLERKVGQSPVSRANENGLLSPPPIIAPRASRDPSPASTTRGPQDDGVKEEKLIAQYMEGPPPIERVPPLPVICFLGFYLSLGALIFSEWESWSFTEGFYFSFITLTTIGFGDYVPGDAVMSVDSKDGQYKLICSVVYLLLGLAVLSMSFNLIQEEAVDFFIKQAKNCGIIDDDDDDEVSER